MAMATAAATNATTAPIAVVIRNAFSVGTAKSPVRTTRCARTTPLTALDAEVPIDRIYELKPLAAPVSVTGTTSMISAGIAP
jgi:hypothetical protein